MLVWQGVGETRGWIEVFFPMNLPIFCSPLLQHASVITNIWKVKYITYLLNYFFKTIIHYYSVRTIRAAIHGHFFRWQVLCDFTSCPPSTLRALLVLHCDVTWTNLFRGCVLQRTNLKADYVTATRYGCPNWKASLTVAQKCVLFPEFEGWVRWLLLSLPCPKMHRGDYLLVMTNEARERARQEYSFF